MKVRDVDTKACHEASAQLCAGFEWSDTPQGIDFWASIVSYVGGLPGSHAGVERREAELDDAIVTAAETIKARRASEAAEKTKALYAAAAATVTPEKIQRVHEALGRARDRGVDLGFDLQVTVRELVGIPAARYASPAEALTGEAPF